MGFLGFFSRDKQQKLDSGLDKTKKSLFSKLAHAVVGKSQVDDDVLDALEETLITSDVGVDTTLEIIKRIQERVARDKYVGVDELNRLLCEEIEAMLALNDTSESSIAKIGERDTPYVIMVVGVNGVGKTTTIGKLAHMFKQAGLNVVLGAADTFRAAAIEQ